jgi:cytochrome c biogenesis protein CcmG/thiol:disulfide interchange protein DsbE
MMRRLPYILPVVVFAALVIGFALSLHGPAPDELPSMLVDKPAPAISLPALDADARGFTAADLKAGHVTVLNVFASWCVPCRVEGPGLAQVAALRGVVLYGMVYKDTPEKARAFLADLGNPYRGIDLDADGRAGIEWGVYGVPETFVIDGKGIVRLRYPGPLVGDALTKIVLPAIEKARGEG